MITINNKVIGDGNPTYIIAEIGSNYNGSLETAEEMIKIASEAGVDAVKFQIFKEKGLYPKDAGKVDYLQMNKSINQLVIENEVPNEYHKTLLDLCNKYNTTYLCTPTDEDLVDYLDSIGVSAFKIASYSLTHYPLLKHVAKKNKPIILSTGSSYIHEIAKAVEVIHGTGNNQLMLMQCVSQYPANINSTNLNVIPNMKKMFNIPIGMSDHSRDPFAVPYASTAIGANLIEKHYTIDRSQDGPDHSFAIEPNELVEMTNGIRLVEKAMGDGVKTVTEDEIEMRKFAHRSIFATTDINPGQEISYHNTAILRPGKKKRGIDPIDYEKVLGAKAINKIQEGQSVTWNDLLQKQ